MKKTCILGIITIILCSCVTENDTYLEISLADVESDDGKVLLADPFIMVYNGVYYAYGTTGSRDFYAYVSSDLEYWERYETPVLKGEDSYGEKWFWAPEVYYNNQDNKFYMYYSAEMWLCVAVSDSPLGPFIQKEKNPLWYGIDPTILMEDEMKYICFVELAERSIISVELMNSLERFSENRPKAVLVPNQEWEGSQTIEGPCIVKVGDKYMMTYSGNDYQSPDYGIGVAVADDPMGPWTKYEGNPVFRYPAYKGVHLEGVGHNSLFKDLDGNWRMVFHAHSVKGIDGGRFMHIVSVDLLDHPPYIVFHDDIFAPKLVDEADTSNTNSAGN